MYASVRCVGPRCCASSRNAYRLTSSQQRNFHQTRRRPAPSDSPSKREDAVAGDDASKVVPKPAISKWRRRQQQLARSHDYMIVDPATGSAEILSASNKAAATKKPKVPALSIPSWFDDCVSWPNTDNEASKKQVAFLPSKDRNVTGMSFLHASDQPAEAAEDGENKLEDPKRIWLDPLLFTEIDGVIRTSLDLPPGKKDTPTSLRSTISIHCPLEGGMPLLNDIVEHITVTHDAGILRLNAQDLAELGGAYVMPDAGLDVSLQSLPFDTYSDAVEEATVEEEDGMAEEDEAAAGEDFESHPKPPKPPQITSMWLSPTVIPLQPGANIGDLLKNLMNGKFPTMSGQTNAKRNTKPEEKDEDDTDTDTEPLMNSERIEKFFNSLIDAAWAKQPKSTSTEQVPEGTRSGSKLIVCVEDLIRLSQTTIGIEAIEKLAEVIRQRRSERGERIALVGLSIDTDLLNSHEPEKTVQWETDHSIWRTFIVLPHRANGDTVTSRHSELQASHAQRNAQINLRNWYITASQMALSLMPDRKHILQPEKKGLGHAIGLSKSVLSRDEIQRLATSSIARVLAQKRDKVGLDDLVSAMSDNRVIDTLREGRLQSLRAAEAKNAPDTFGSFSNLFTPNMAAGMPLGFGGPDMQTPSGSSAVFQKLQALQKEADRYEKKLLNGVVLPEKISTTFADVHVAKTTVEAVRDLTALSLQRPDAFKYGVLATNTLSGLLLYGPPGTGKTMLAKAVAKESDAAVLTVTGSDVNQMWVGESEKTVKAIFSLARKLSPCVVFVDEADALLASRGSDGRGGRPNHRDTINQFLLEWDGMNESGVFLMVATNRPFDLDDAVLRRLPRRVLVDLPTKEDREAILRIHLKGEQLAEGVSVSELAQRTPYYSGSDLKNVVVSAALSAVRDELEARKAAEANNDTYEYPEKRTLGSEHFEKAIGEVGASVSEDMSSLRAIRKFDEQYGERKGRRKKTPFGLGRPVEREEEGRVRVSG